MSPLLVTQCVVPDSITQAYDWHLADQPERVLGTYEYDGTAWIYEPPQGSQQQYELFLEPCVEAGSVFEHLVEEWHKERGVSSSTTDIILASSYQSIIGMGPVAVPLILAQIEAEGDDPDQWFWALQVLTGANPVAEEDEGDFQAMSRAWLDWARKRYVW